VKNEKKKKNQNNPILLRLFWTPPSKKEMKKGKPFAWLRADGTEEAESQHHHHHHYDQQQQFCPFLVFCVRFFLEWFAILLLAPHPPTHPPIHPAVPPFIFLLFTGCKTSFFSSLH